MPFLTVFATISPCKRGFWTFLGRFSQVLKPPFFSLKWLKIIYLGKNTLKNTRIFANELDNGSKYAIYLIFSVIRVVAKVILTFIIILICKSKNIN